MPKNDLQNCEITTYNKFVVVYVIKKKFFFSTLL